MALPMDWDLVVVGAGSAGAVIAARVTEDPGQRVLVLEAGPHYPDVASLPEDLKDSRKSSVEKHDWGLLYEPTRLQGSMKLPLGKVTGGSSAVNTAVALRGRPEDYDEWAALGCPEWSWSHCLPAFLRIETDHDFADEWHGKSGPIPIRRARQNELVPMQAAFLKACAALGWPQCPDHNHPSASGFGPQPMNKDGTLRVSTAVGYLMPAQGRQNLHIRPNTLVRRVLFAGRQATGVEVETNGQVEEIPAGRIVLSAGAIHTPAILVRSGIGPKATLERLGIAGVRYLPVGETLIDTPGVGIALRPETGVASYSDPFIQTVLRYTAKASTERDDMQLLPLSHIALIVGLPLMVSIAAAVQKPHSRGRLIFESANPHIQPRIHPNLAGDPRDIDRLVEAVEIAVKLAHTDAIRSIAPAIVWPGADVLESPEAIRRWIPAACLSGYHPVGTTPMGASDNPASVVDPHGRVHGIKGLHVADAGIMPTMPAANTNLSTIMIGERFGEWLRQGRI